MTFSRMMLVALLTTLFSLPAHAGPPHSTPASRNVRIARTLARMHDPDALVTAALMQPLAIASLTYGTRVSDGEAANDHMSALLQKARKLQPASADIVGLTMMSCHLSQSCDAQAMGRQLHAIDPDNAYAWMPALQHARSTGDAEAVTAILDRMAQSRRYDSYWITTLGRIDRALKLAPTPDGKALNADQRASDAMALAGFAIPEYTDLIKACDPADPAFPTRRSSCRAIGVMMETSPMLISNMIGTTLHRRAARDHNDYDHALEITRDLAWTQDKFASVAGNDMRLHGLKAYLHDIRTTGTETGAMRRVLQRAHVSTQPAPDWTNHQFMHLLKEDHSPYSAGVHGKG